MLCHQRIICGLTALCCCCVPLSDVKALDATPPRVGTTLPSNRAATQPVGLSCDPAIVDLGIVEINQEIKTKWRINNRTERDVHVTKIRPGCGCTKAEIQNAPDGLIAAGGFVDVVATVLTKHVRGPKNVRIMIETDAPDSPVIEANVKLSVTPPVRLDSKSMDFGEVVARVGAVKSMTLSADKAIDFNIVAIKAVELDRMKVSVKEVSKGKEYELTISIVPGAKVGTMRTIVKLETDNPKVDVIEVPVFAKIVDRP